MGVQCCFEIPFRFPLFDDCDELYTSFDTSLLGVFGSKRLKGHNDFICCFVLIIVLSVVSLEMHPGTFEEISVS